MAIMANLVSLRESHLDTRPARARSPEQLVAALALQTGLGTACGPGECQRLWQRPMGRRATGTCDSELPRRMRQPPTAVPPLFERRGPRLGVVDGDPRRKVRTGETCCGRVTLEG